MSYVVARPKESFESLLKRFNKSVEKAGILADFRKHEFYEKPSIKRKRKQAAARKRALKEQKKREQAKMRNGSNKNFRWNKDRTKKLPLSPPRKPNNPIRNNTNFNNKKSQPKNKSSYRGKKS